MSRAIEIIQVGVRSLVNGVLAPFNTFNPTIGLSVISVIAGILLILAYKKISFQAAIAKTKKTIHAALLESIVFRHDTFQCLSAQRRMFLYGGRYLLLAIPPILILAIPSIFLLAELQTRYGYRPVKSGETIIVRAKVKDPKLLNSTVLSVDPEVEVAGPVRSIKSSELYWRLSSQKTGVYHAIIKVGGVPAISQEIAVGQGVGRLGPEHYYSGWHQLLFPLDITSNVTRDSFSQIQFSYPATELNFLGFEMNWVFVFLIVSMCAGLALSRVLGIEV